MKNIIKLLLPLSIIVIGCTKENFDDVSLLDGDKAPAALSAMYNITQDNSGQVTITPNGEGLAYTLVYFGDGTATPEKVSPGQSVTHKYGEGSYSVKIRGVSVTGITTEASQPLTVSFRKPENLKVNADIDATNKFKVNVSATANFETFFQVYFGDVANEVPRSFLEGETISYVYSKTGTYTVKVVALSGGAAKEEFTKVIEIRNPVLLPITFEDAAQPYPFINFDGGNVTVVNNPFKTGINTSDRVGKMVKGAGQPWGGSVIALGNPINFNDGKFFRMKVYSPRIGAKVLLKVENPTDGSISFEKEVTTTKANAWEDLVFDFNAVNTSRQYQNIVLIFELGTVGDGSGNFTFYFDDIRQEKAIASNTPVLPVDFESSAIVFDFINFDGGVSTVVNNPLKAGINTSDKVAKMIKFAGQPWGGSVLKLGSPINFSTNKIFKLKVLSPRAGAKVLFKVENATDGSIAFEKEAVTTVANAWEELSFDFSAINTARSYQNIVLIFELGTVGDGSNNFTFHYDDIRLTSGTVAEKISLPLTFESTTLNYSFLNFDGGNASVVANPFKTAANNSNRVGKMVKGTGQPWGGAFITLDEPINFTAGKTFRVKVYSPRAGAKLLLKVENKDNANQNFEKEVATTKAGEWETLTFDYSAINTANKYDRVVLIFDLGTVGDGSGNFTFYFDDITLN